MKERLHTCLAVDGTPTLDTPRRLEVVIEIPKGSFLKRGSCGTIDFVSPLPCPFNYGSAPAWLGGEGDLLDAIVLGPRLAAGTRLEVTARVAVGLAERHMYDDKLVCSEDTLTSTDYRRVITFMHFYAFCKGFLNRLRGRAGPTYCTGWEPLDAAMMRAVPVPPDWSASPVEF
jgi:inorganic pyrophosphatase